MYRPKPAGVALVALLLIVLISGYELISKENTLKKVSTQVSSTEILTWDCEYPEYQPETIMIYCGDGGAYVDKIKWENWSQQGARGKGEYYVKLCEPNCAEGDIAHAPVTVKLSDLTLYKGKNYLRTLDIASVDGKDFSWGESGTFHWDVMEFAKQMNSE